MHGIHCLYGASVCRYMYGIATCSTVLCFEVVLHNIIIVVNRKYSAPWRDRFVESNVLITATD